VLAWRLQRHTVLLYSQWFFSKNWTCVLVKYSFQKITNWCPVILHYEFATEHPKLNCFKSHKSMKISSRTVGVLFPKISGNEANLKGGTFSEPEPKRSWWMASSKLSLKSLGLFSIELGTSIISGGQWLNDWPSCNPPKNCFGLPSPGNKNRLKMMVKNVWLTSKYILLQLNVIRFSDILLQY